jgi:hypothetical protein
MTSGSQAAQRPSLSDLTMPVGEWSLLRWLAAATLMLWVTVLLHEAAHFGLAAVLYTSQDLTSGSPPPLRQLAVVGAGPVTTLAMLAGALWIAQRRPTPPLAIVLGCAAATRILFIAPSVILGPGNYDESTIATILGLPVRLITGAETLVAIVAVVLLLRKTPIPRRAAIAGTVIGILLGVVTIGVFGPLLGLPI